ncbi:hypothetical protein PRAG_00174 [Prochlorococcus phage P-SSM3]|uniref:Uncharacterized protein n=1 Tax=Prochlorococcus phage P-SSM3 TaxID=536453 RepID=R9S7Q8_9CAUD|nr:hypothetical protein PRAG_00174 [Prochlorococcus phage P-SSM3]AGN12111.1 hypothetical protein PRAG_00174 [Prochlorococcus phage P-SSM3]
MDTHRIRVYPRETASRKAKDLFKYHMRRDPNMWITERLDKWAVRNPTTGIGFWVHPTNDPDWIVKR